MMRLSAIFGLVRRSLFPKESREFYFTTVEVVQSHRALTFEGRKSLVELCIIYAIEFVHKKMEIS